MNKVSDPAERGPTPTSKFFLLNMTNILKKLISFRTASDNPKEIKKALKYTASVFDKKIFKIENFEKNGKYSQLVSFRGKNAHSPRILMNGHIDVVPAESKDQYKLRIKKNLGYGRGTADMKGMLTVLISVMREAKNFSTLPDVALLITGDEELGGEYGAGFLVEDIGIRPQFVLCADSTDEKRRLVAKQKGGLWLELETRGKSAHAAHPWIGENALDKLIENIKLVKEWIGEIEPEAWKTTVTLSSMSTSNKTHNKVPLDARAILDIRFTEEFAKNPRELHEKIRSLLPETKLRIINKISPLFADEKNDFIQRFKKIYEEISGKEIPFGIEHGGTDARFFGEVGIPALIFGAVGGGWHARNEWVDIKSLEESRKILLRFISEA